jgi:hypothetical protein
LVEHSDEEVLRADAFPATRRQRRGALLDLPVERGGAAADIDPSGCDDRSQGSAVSRHE